MLKNINGKIYLVFDWEILKKSIRIGVVFAVGIILGYFIA